MKKALSLTLAAPLIMAALLFTGCEDDDPSGTATVTGNVRQFYSDSTTIRTARAKAVAGVTIELRTVDGSYTALTTSEADGSFLFENVPAGDFDLILTGGGTTGKITFNVPDGATVRLVDIVVKKDGTVYAGEIARKDPEPEPEVTVTTSTEIPSPPVSTGLDQSQTASNSDLGLEISQTVAQVFTPGVSGNLTKIELDVLPASGHSPVADITVTIRTYPGPNPGFGVDLGSATIAAGDVAGQGTWETATFAAPIALNAGTQYSIVCTSTATFPPGYYAWRYAGGDPYAGGAGWMFWGGIWSVQFGADFTFRTYMQ